jgi:hypothetical protein
MSRDAVLQVRSRSLVRVALCKLLGRVAAKGFEIRGNDFVGQPRDFVDSGLAARDVGILLAELFQEPLASGDFLLFGVLLHPRVDKSIRAGAGLVSIAVLQVHDRVAGLLVASLNAH